MRNYAARLHLKAMRPGDRVFFYESMGPKSVVGIAQVTRAAFPDPTVDEVDGWMAVELKAVKPLPKPVTLMQIKADRSLADIALLRQSRLSVQPLSFAAFSRIAKLGGA